MISRLGVSIHATEICAVLVEGRSIRWHASIDRGTSDSLADAITSLLSTLPKIAGIRRATIAVGPSECHVKQLEGLPALSDAGMLTRLLHENGAAFFLAGDRQALSAVARFENGTSWAAAFDREIAVTAIGALKKSGFINARVSPSTVALGSVVPAGVIEWTDGECHTEISTDESGHIFVRRLLSRASDEPPRFPETLTQVGAGSWAIAAAFGAAKLSKTSPFVWRPAPDPKRVARRRRVRGAMLVVLLASSVLAAAVAPGVRAAQTIRYASTALTKVRTSQTEFARLQGELQRASLALERIDQFQAQRGRLTLLLGALSEALPESTALASLRVDSLEGSFVALTPHAADVLPQLTTVTDLIAPRIVGSLTKETVGGAQVQRATVRFTRALSPNRAKPVRDRG
jgi:hypothetical protein